MTLYPIGVGFGFVWPISPSSFDFYGGQASIGVMGECLCPHICPTAVRMEYNAEDDWHPTESFCYCFGWDKNFCPRYIFTNKVFPNSVLARIAVYQRHNGGDTSESPLP